MVWKKKLKRISYDVMAYIQIETEAIRKQLMELHKKSMRVKIKNPNDRPYIDIKYPKGYKG